MKIRGCRHSAIGTYLIISGLALILSRLLPAGILVFILTVVLIAVGVIILLNS